MRTQGSSLHGSYFELLKAKYPDLKSGAFVPPIDRPPLPRRDRRARKPLLWLAAALVLVLVVGVAARSAPPATATSAATGHEPSARELVAALVAELKAEAAAESTTAKETLASAPRSSPAPRPASAPVVVPTREAAAPLEARRQVERVVSEPVGGLEELARLADEAAGLAATASPGQQSDGGPPPASAIPELMEAHRVSSFQPARKVFSPAPEYPGVARRAGLEGAVVMEAKIDPLGVVRDTRVIEGRSSALDRAAGVALRKWRFEPATRDGEPVASSYRVSFDFTLRPTRASAEREDGPSTRSAVVVEPLEVGGEVMAPRRLIAPLPTYPDVAWAEGVTGDVLVRAVIDERGKVRGVEVLRGLPHGMTEAAVDAIRRWRFAPATLHGEAVAVYRNLSVRFET